MIEFVRIRREDVRGRRGGDKGERDGGRWEEHRQIHSFKCKAKSLRVNAELQLKKQIKSKVKRI